MKFERHEPKSRTGRLHRWKQGHVAPLLDRLSATRIPDDVVVVSGFLRSGTTWLQESLARLYHAKTVFEPCHPLAARKLLAEAAPGRDLPYLTLYMLHGERQDIAGGALGRFLSDSLTSRLSGWETRVLRSGLREATLRRCVVKFVRGHLFLCHMAEALGVSAVHVVRDPRAVAASAKRDMRRWGPAIEAMSLRDLLLAPGDGRRVHFERFGQLLAEYDKSAPLVRLIAYWAAVERFVRDELASTPGTQVTSITYEDLLADPGLALAPFFARLSWGFRPPAEIERAFAKPSQTSLGRSTASNEERRRGFHKVLDADELKEIEEAVRAFGLEETLD